MPAAGAGLLLTLFGCMASGNGVEKAFAGKAPPEFHTYELGNRHLFTAETGNPDGPLVVFVHGSPGSWSDYAGFLADPSLSARARLVAVDRPGFGKSDPGRLETSLARQAAMVRLVLEGHPRNRPAILVGHSLGGPVVARLAMDAPSLVDGLVLVAASIDPAMERTAWYVAASRWRIVHWMVPHDLVLADDEIKPLKAELTDMLPRWRDLTLPVTEIQGDDDALVSPQNADFAERMLVSAKLRMVRVPKQGHLIPWQRPDLIRDAVLGMLDSLPARN